MQPDQAPGLPDGLDLFGPQFQDNPPAIYEQLRRSGAVRYLPRHGWYLVTKAEAVREVLRDAERFSSRVYKHTQPPAEVADEVAQIRAQGWPYTPALGTNDPPDHTRLRRLVQRAFTPRSLAWMEPLVRQTAEELAATLPDGAELDFLAAFAEPLPVWAISRVLGLPESRRGDIRRWSVAAAASIGGMPDAKAWIENERTLLHYQQTMAAEIEQVRQAPGEGLLSTLVQAADNPGPGEDPIPMAQLLTLLRELVIAGNETSGKLITEIVRLLDTKPGEWDRIRTEPDEPGRSWRRRCAGRPRPRPRSGVRPATRNWPVSTFRRVRFWWSRSLRRTGTRTSTPMRPGSTPTVTDCSSSWPSVWASTPASATRSPGWKP